jgi:hypothetical protein
MHVDEPRRDDESLRIDDAFRFSFDSSDRGNAVAIDRDIAVEPWIASAIHDAAVADDQIERRGKSGRDKATKQKPCFHLDG